MGGHKAYVWLIASPTQCGGYVLEVALAHIVGNPIGRVMQSGRVAVDNAVAVADDLQLSGKIGIIGLRLLRRFAQR